MAAKIIIIIVVFILAIWFGAPLISFTKQEPKERVPDSQVQLLSATYQKLERELVHGKLSVEINPALNLNNHTALICPITDGEIWKVGEVLTLECKVASKKSILIENNSFSIQLLSGTYFIDIEDKQTDKLPARVNIHKGEEATTSL